MDLRPTPRAWASTPTAKSGALDIRSARHQERQNSGALDDTQLRRLEERLSYLRDLNERRATIVASITAQGKMSPPLAAALEAAESSLTAAGVTCQGITVSVDTGGYQAAAAGAAQVEVTVTCGVSWSDLTIPGWPGSKTITSQATSPLDLKKIGT